MKIYLVYEKDTKVYKGNEFKKEVFERKKTKMYQNCEYIEKDFEEWQEFLKTNPEIIKIEDGNLTSHERIRTLDELKNNALDVRKSYLKQTFINWFDDVENIPQETKDKRTRAKKEIDEIKVITNKEDLLNYENF
jgi:hypothetical protein